MIFLSLVLAVASGHQQSASVRFERLVVALSQCDQSQANNGSLGDSLRISPTSCILEQASPALTYARIRFVRLCTLPQVWVYMQDELTTAGSRPELVQRISNDVRRLQRSALLIRNGKMTQSREGDRRTSRTLLPSSEGEVLLRSAGTV